MKHPVAVALLVAFSTIGFAAEAPPGVPASTNVPNAQYPRVLPDNSVVFRVKAPEAKSVKFQLGPTVDAVRDDEGFWTATTAPQVPGFHYYWLVVDGVRVNDPGSETFYGTGAQTSGIEIPEPGQDGAYYEAQDVPHGEIRERWYQSSVTGTQRRFFIYTPPGYDQSPDRRYPVLILQHGGAEDERAWPIQGRAGQIMDNLIAAGKAKPMLIVMERGYAVRKGEVEEPMGPPPAGGSGGPPADFMARMMKRFTAFEEVIVKDVIPFVDANYRTIPDREHRAIAGFSMGGMQAFMIGLKHLDTFASIGGLSGTGGGFGGGELDPATYYDGVFADPAAFNARMKLIFLGHGSVEPDRMMQNLVGYHDSLTKLGINHVYYVSEGTSHEWLTERRNLRELATHLFN